jgi:hypothetical protein
MLPSHRARLTRERFNRRNGRMRCPELLVLCSECGEGLGVGDVDVGANRLLLYLDAGSPVACCRDQTPSRYRWRPTFEGRGPSYAMSKGETRPERTLSSCCLCARHALRQAPKPRRLFLRWAHLDIPHGPLCIN